LKNAHRRFDVAGQRHSKTEIGSADLFAVRVERGKRIGIATKRDLHQGKVERRLPVCFVKRDHVLERCRSRQETTALHIGLPKNEAVVRPLWRICNGQLGFANRRCNSVSFQSFLGISERCGCNAVFRRTIGGRGCAAKPGGAIGSHPEREDGARRRQFQKPMRDHRLPPFLSVPQSFNWPLR